MAKAGVPRAADERLRRRLLGGAARDSRPNRALALGLAFGCVGVVALLLLTRRPAPEIATVAPTPTEGITVESASADAVVQREAEGLRLVAGRIVVAVHKRARGLAPARVLVSGGAIEIMGTRFTVVQEGDGGQVTLHEGSIRFVGADGAITMMVPGQTVRWPSAPAPGETASAEPPRAPA